MARELVGFMDIFRVGFIVLLTLLVGIFIAPIAPWIFWLSIFACFYTVFLEILKFYLGIQEMRSKRQKSLVILNG